MTKLLIFLKNLQNFQKKKKEKKGEGGGDFVTTFGL
jgi:hypothetical protein